MTIQETYQLSAEDTNRIIEMAWEDRTPFDAIFFQFKVPEKAVIKLMRQELHLKSWKNWRARVQGRSTKHTQKAPDDLDRFRCSRQRSISNNKISKR